MDILEDHIANVTSPEAKERMRLLAALIGEEAPDAVLTKSYGMPAWKVGGKPLLYLAVCREHIGFYPTGTGMTAIADDLGDLPHSKGAVQLPHDLPLPLEQIQRWIRVRVRQATGGQS